MKALIASVALLLTAPARADEIVIASPAAWCPLSCQAGSAREGFAVDIAREIFTAAGHRVRLVNEPYSRAVLDVRAGVFTATASTFREEAPDFVFPTQPISRNRFCVYVPADSTWTYRGAASLSELQRVGVIGGHAYGTALDVIIRTSPQRFDVHAGDGLTERLLRRLQGGRVDAVIEEENVVAYTRQQHAELAPRNAGCEAPNYAYLAFSPRHPKAQAYARIFSDGMQKLRRTGRLKAILATYSLVEWPAWTPP